MNPQNLEGKRFGEIPTEKHKAASSKGGKASGEAKRQRKMLAETLKDMLEKDEEGMTLQEKGCAAILRKYARGNLRAFEVVRDTIGEKPVDKVMMSTVDKSVEEMEAYFKELECEKKKSST